MLIDNVKALCEKRGITVAELERKTGTGNGVIGRWDESSPRVATLQKVAEYFGVTLDELVKDTGSA